MFIDSGRIIDVLGKELKVDTSRDEWKKFISQGRERTILVGEDS